MRSKNQVLIFNDQELALIKQVFAENEDLLYLVRKVLLQFELTAEEKKIIKSSITPEVFAVIKKRVYPDVMEDAPFSQLGDIYQTLTQDLKSKTVNEMAPLFDAKQLEVEYLDQQFARLKNIDSKSADKIKLNDWASLVGKEPYQRYVQTMARNFILGYVDPMLNLLKSIAGQKTETIEETKKRITRDSSK